MNEYTNITSSETGEHGRYQPSEEQIEEGIDYMEWYHERKETMYNRLYNLLIDDNQFENIAPLMTWIRPKHQQLRTLLTNVLIDIIDADPSYLTDEQLNIWFMAAFCCYYPKVAECLLNEQQRRKTHPKRLPREYICIECGCDLRKGRHQLTRPAIDVIGRMFHLPVKTEIYCESDYE